MSEGDADHKIDPVKRHRTQAAWQIWVPLGLAIALFIALCVLSTLATMNDLPISKTLAPVAVIWVVIPNCLSGLFTLAILVGCVFLAAKMLGGVSRLGNQISGALYKLQTLVQKFSDRVAEPVIKASSLQAKLARYWKSIWPGKSHQEGV